MQSIRVAAVSMNSQFGQTEQVLEEVNIWSEKAADGGAELVLFPEQQLRSPHAADAGHLDNRPNRHRWILPERLHG